MGFNDKRDVEAYYDTEISGHIFFACKELDESIVLYAEYGEYYINYSDEAYWNPIKLDLSTFNYTSLKMENNLFNTTIANMIRHLSENERRLSLISNANGIDPVLFNVKLDIINDEFLSILNDMGIPFVDRYKISLQILPSLINTIVTMSFTMDRTEKEISMFLLGAAISAGLVDTRTSTTINGLHISDYNKPTLH